MAIDLFSIVLNAGVSWGIDCILDTIISCEYCGQQTSDRIENSQFNHIECSNCNQHTIQFTNACYSTVDAVGNIGHVGAEFPGSFEIFDDVGYEGLIYFPMHARSLNMPNRQFVATCEIKDYESDTLFSKGSNRILTTEYEYENTFWEGEFITAQWDHIPEEYRDNRVFAIDLTIRSEYGELLYTNRKLEHLWW